MTSRNEVMQVKRIYLAEQFSSQFSIECNLCIFHLSAPLTIKKQTHYFG